MINSGHIVHIIELNHMLKESLLTPVSNFVSVQSNSGDDDIDGDYVVINIKRGKVLRRIAVVGILRRWKEYTNAIMLNNYADCSSCFYVSYSNGNCSEEK